jgi:hypothetical protein
MAMKWLFSKIAIFSVVLLAGCSPEPQIPLGRVVPADCVDALSKKDESSIHVKEVLLSTRYSSLTSLRSVVEIKCIQDTISWFFGRGEPILLIDQCTNGRRMIADLKSGVSEGDFRTARDGGIWDKIYLCLRSPYVLLNRQDLFRVYNLARRRNNVFGQGDVAFFDLAENMVCHILESEVARMPPRDTSEKGYINTFNHVTAQAFVTSMFSETLADFIADSHERFSMPELLTGQFTQDQLSDPENNPIDNYVDIVNNEWGQELGKELKLKYGIDEDVVWTQELLSNYLNDVQAYFSWAFGIHFIPFDPSDDVILHYTKKINMVLVEANI